MLEKIQGLPDRRARDFEFGPELLEYRNFAANGPFAIFNLLPE
jgi:hypothetical protein